MVRNRKTEWCFIGIAQHQLVLLSRSFQCKLNFHLCIYLTKRNRNVPLKLQEDIENYTRIRHDPNAFVRLRKGALPGIFDCQPDRQRSHVEPTRPGVLKRQKMKTLNKILQTVTVIDTSRECECAESVTTKSLHIDTNIGNWNNIKMIIEHIIFIDLNCV